MNNSEKVNKYLNSTNIQELTNTNIEEWYLANRIGMIKHMPEILGNYEIKEQTISSEDIQLKKVTLFEHQKFVRDYLQSKSPYRGLLLYHSLGSGKSLTAIATSELLLKEKEVIVILPAYLKNNFIEEVKKYGNKFYTKEQYWEFIELKNINIENIANIKRISEDIIRKNKGIWISNSKKKNNWLTLTQENQNQIMKQINDIIEKRYHFIHLDGLRKTHIKEFKENPDQFENKVIIIDEVHNFISQVIGGGIARTLYEILLTRTTSKFICLSGSPMVNYPEEIAYLVNLLKGYEKVFIFKRIPRSIINTEELNNVLSKEKKLDFYEYDDVNELLKIKLLPIGFSKTKNERVKYDNELFSDDKIIKDILAQLKKNKMLFNGKYKTTKFLSLPLNRNEFNNLFVDQGKLTVKNPNLFTKRILGSISYYTASGTKDIYPTLNDTKLELLTFKDEQFKKYLDARIKERKSESNKKQGLFSSNEQVYKAYSRALCNFIFPKEIPRPYPSDIKYLDNDEFNFTEDDSKAIKLDKLLTNSLNKLIEGDYLEEDNLINYSPKFDKIYKNILTTKGTALVYSSFRTVEGVFLFTKVLDKRGYAEFKVKKNKVTGNWAIDISEEDRLKPKYMIFSSDKEQNNLLLKIFNSEIDDTPTNIQNELANYDTMNTNDNNLHGSIIKIIMITRSGSEGISLKNVRQVHLIEPYWNQVRLDQVIGRAVRANSHKDLPKSERFVDVFKYIMKFTDEQIKNDFTIRRKDHSLTTDQVIDNISFKKMKIISKLQQLMKEASVDCLVNHKNNPELQCFTFPLNLNDKDIIVKPDINEDELNSNVEKVIQTKNISLKKVIILTKPFMINIDTSELFDYNLWKNNNIVKMIGFLEKIDEDNYRLTVIKKYIKNVI
jgi:superfamily II DNA or RNA helicase